MEVKILRIVYINLHTNTFVLKTLSYLINGQRVIDKHRFIIDKLLENNVEVVNFITLNGSSLPGKFIRNRIKSLFLRKIEAAYVIKKNNLPLKKIKFMYDINELKKDDILIFYGHFPETQFDIPVDVRGIKIADHIHFYGDLETANKMRQQNIKYYICEIDLKKYCGLYNQNYSWFNGTYIPRKFSYQPRFKNLKSFSERKNKAVAMGTLTTCDIPEFLEYYGTNIYQPKRQMIFDNKELLSKEVDSYISNYQETSRKKIDKKDNKIKIIYKKAFNYLTNGKQKNYFSFDMVEKYNEYKMFICPEDALGAYGIGVIE